MTPMENIIAILECLRDFIVDRDSEKSFDMSTALLLEMIELYGVDSPIMVTLFPLLERIKTDVQQQKFDDALPKVLTLLAKFRQAQEEYTDHTSNNDPDIRASVAPNETNHGGPEIKNKGKGGKAGDTSRRLN
jgi:hypothetical protein